MSSISFTPGSKSHFFAALAAKYGFLFVEGAKQKRIFTCEQGEQFLKKQVAKERISQEEAEVLKQMIFDAGLALNMTEFFALITAATLPVDFVSQYKFVACTDCGMPIVHGRMQDAKSGEFISNPLNTAEEGLSLVFELLEEGGSNPLDCISFLQEMIVAGVPMDADSGQKMFEALPPDVIEALKQKTGFSGSVSQITIPGLGTMFVMELTRQPAASVSEPLQEKDLSEASAAPVAAQLATPAQA